MISEKNEKKIFEITVKTRVLEENDPIFKYCNEDDKMNDDKIPLTVAPE